ncbi:hypothetical protein IFM89_001320 [Coptis chinensis]|uniref:Uncharacterized protein n=1 Tax=Coptis chinensis TaxID=261450 RepID=A0A835GTL8_9MAGN|nr:hypothetical protein IFM89_001320 [Coptis chinensis]
MGMDHNESAVQRTLFWGLGLLLLSFVTWKFIEGNSSWILGFVILCVALSPSSLSSYDWLMLKQVKCLRVVEQPNGSSLPSSEVGHETNEKQKKRKKKERGKDKTGVLVDDKTDDVSKEEPVKDEVNKKPFTHKTEDGSAEVKEKSDKKVVKASKKKHKDCVDEVTDAKRTEDVSVELKEKSDGKVIKASKKKVGNGGDQVSSKKKAADGGDQVTGTKRKVVDVIDSETERIDDTAIATNLVAGENTSEKKKRKKKKKNKTAE